MSAQRHQAATRPYRSEQLPRSRSIFVALMRRMLRRLEYGRLLIEAPSGEHLVIEGRRPGAHAQVTVHSWRFLWRLITRGDMGFAESYIAGEWSSPRLGMLMTFALQNATAVEPVLPGSRIILKLRHALNRNTKWGSRRNIAAHYDLGNEFYAQWLDASMSYSSGLFSAAGQTLEESQEAKFKRVFDLLEVTGGERVLEIGCGWGGLAERLISRYRCNVTGITLSARQLEFARERLRHGDMLQYGDLRLQDYRDVRGSYDRIVSIEMLEAVGAAYWSTYFKQLRENLQPGGVAVLQVITIDEERFEAYRRQPDFIQRYIFPGGMLPTKRIVEQELVTAGLTLVATERFGESYARTLVHWQRYFQEAWPAIERLGFDQCFKRTWEYYLAYCQAGFEAQAVDVGLYKIRRAERLS